MGNSSTKEARPPPSPSPRQSSFRLPMSPPSPISNQSQGQSFDRPTLSMHSSRPSRSSRPDITFLGIGGNSDNTTGLENRRETKQEREARKLEKERVARLKERERSMREEGVDGGYLVTQGVYVGTEDFSKPVVRQLMIERRVAPFWKGLNDHSDSWTENQLVAAARGLPIPAPDEIPPEDQYRMPPSNVDEPRHSDKNLKNLTVPMSSRSQSYNSDSSANISPSYPAYSLPSPPSPLGSPNSSSSPLFRGRSKTLASLTTSSKNNSQSDMTPREFHLPRDPFVNGQPLEAYLYKDASECPICFLYYPPYLNKTRCCDQPICSECFVQIKRPDPHPPEHEHNDPNSPPPVNPVPAAETDGQLVSEPAACPFCVQPEFGITYNPPPFKRGITYAMAVGSHPLANAASAMSSSSSLASGTGTPAERSRRRATSLSANAPSVITTDRIRPDWAQKLATARAHAARRSAAATALHTAAYLMNSREGPPPGNFGPFGRRGVLRRVPGGSPDSPGGATGSSHLNALALLAERHGSNSARTENGPFSEGEQPPATFLAPPRGSSTRRSRIDELEDMMMLEAIRLSLAAEEERRKKEEKEAKKEAKKKEKESKKAEKAARKAGVYQHNFERSGLTLNNNSDQDSPVWRPESEASSLHGEGPPVPGKGKAVDREGATTVGQSSVGDNLSLNNIPGISLSGPPKADTVPISTSPMPIASSDPPRRSHLRQMSNASSSASSFVESVPSSLKNVLSGSTSSFDGSLNPQTEGMRSSTPPGAAAGLEPMFNFRSLAAMIGDEEKAENSSHVEHAPSNYDQSSEDLIDLSPANSNSAGPMGSSSHDKTPTVETKESDIVSNGMTNGNNTATAS